MLHEVAASDLDVTHIVNPMRKMLQHVRFFEGEVRSVHLAERRVVVAHGFDRHTHSLEYDHIVFGLGCAINFYNIPGLRERALPMKSLGDAIALRNRLIERLEEAGTDCAEKDRAPLLTFVVAGAGFAGVETTGSINDLLKGTLPYYRTSNPRCSGWFWFIPAITFFLSLGNNSAATPAKSSPSAASRSVPTRK